MDTGDFITGNEAVKEVTVSHCGNLLGSSNHEFVAPIEANEWNWKTLSDEMKSQLGRPVTKDEIKQVFHPLNEDKAYNLDGYNAHFFKKAWLVVGEAVLGGIML